MTRFRVRKCSYWPDSALPHWPNPSSIFLYLRFPSTSLSISTFQAFQLSTLHQRPNSVLQRLTKERVSNSRHGKKKKIVAHTWHFVRCSLKLGEKKNQLWDCKNKHLNTKTIQRICLMDPLFLIFLLRTMNTTLHNKAINTSFPTDVSPLWANQ